ncbi:hypothetical protein J6590_015128 [Homalodisca vitripennis]|nr:hypothetical protein J6590_015128 [Homalodisca vitripennis]
MNPGRQPACCALFLIHDSSQGHLLGAAPLPQPLAHAWPRTSPSNYSPSVIRECLEFHFPQQITDRYEHARHFIYFLLFYKDVALKWLFENFVETVTIYYIDVADPIDAAGPESHLRIPQGREATEAGYKQRNLPQGSHPKGPVITSDHRNIRALPSSMSALRQGGNRLWRYGAHDDAALSYYSSLMCQGRRNEGRRGGYAVKKTFSHLSILTILSEALFKTQDTLPTSRFFVPIVRPT